MKNQKRIYISILPFYLVLAFSFLYQVSLAQANLIDSITLKESSNYIYNLEGVSDANLIGFSVNQQTSDLFSYKNESQIPKQLRSFPGASQGKFSHNGDYYLYLKSNYELDQCLLATYSFAEDTIYYLEVPPFSEFETFNKSNKLILYSKGKFTVFNFETQQFEKGLILDISEVHNKSLSDIHLYPDDRKFLINYTQREKVKIKVYGVENGILLNEIEKEAWNVYNFHNTKDGSRYVYTDGSLLIYRSTVSDQLVDSFRLPTENKIDQIVLSDDGRTVYYLEQKFQICRYDLESKQMDVIYELNLGRDNLSGLLLFGNESKLLTCVDGKVLYLFDVTK